MFSYRLHEEGWCCSGEGGSTRNGLVPVRGLARAKRASRSLMPCEGLASFCLKQVEQLPHAQITFELHPLKRRKFSLIICPKEGSDAGGRRAAELKRQNRFGGRRFQITAFRSDYLAQYLRFGGWWQSFQFFQSILTGTGRPNFNQSPLSSWSSAWAALIRPRCVNAWGKLPRCSPAGPSSSA